MSFANLRLGTRLGLGIFGSVSIMIIIAIIGIVNILDMQKKLDVLVNKEFSRAEWANNMHDGVTAIGIYMRDSLLVTGQSNIKKKLDDIIIKRIDIKNNLDNLQAVMISDADKTVLAKVADARANYIKSQEVFIKLVEEDKREAAQAYLMQESMELQDNYIKILKELVEYQNYSLKNIGYETDKQVKNSLNMIITIMMMALVGAVLVGYIITRSITRPLQEAVKAANAVAQGDLTLHIEDDSKSEVGQLMRALQQMNTKLRSIIADVHINAEAITQATREIASGNMDLSIRTEEQSTSLEDAASSMRVLTSTVRQNAEDAMQANQLANSASDIAVRGGQAVVGVENTIASISSSSKKISGITSVIDNIAFQTNILALNAAVEAARAGEQGRGFAVVAAEVRNLSQRAAAAAKDIKILIDDTVNKVDAGTVQIQQAGATMSEVVHTVKRVTALMSKISTSSNKQSADIALVSQVIMRMEEDTQRNAALVEESAAAAEAMHEQAGVLFEAVNVFKLDSSGKSERELIANPSTSHVIRPVITHQAQLYMTGGEMVGRRRVAA